MSIIKPKQTKIVRTIRIKPEIDKEINEIAKQTGESKTHVIEQLLLFGIKAYSNEIKSK